MTSRQRVLDAIDHKTPDRIPLDIGAINNTCMHATIQHAVKKRLDLEESAPTIRGYSLGVAVPDESVLQYFGADTRSIYFDEVHPWRHDAETDIYYDQWKIGYKRNPDGYYYNFATHPLADAEEPEDIEAFEFFTPNERMTAGLEERIASFKGEYCLVLEGFRESCFGLPSALRGHENFYMDLISDDGMADALLDKIVAHFKNQADYIIDRLGGKVDIVKVADDLGTQNSLLISPETYRDMIKPRQAELYRHIKEKTGCKILLHSCGAISPIIDDLIEIGVDALNPVQISADGMEPSYLKKTFGDRITFWGGGIDTQKVLSFGSPDDVRREVRKNIELFRDGGGYVFAPVHNIMPGVPVDNILAMYETYRECAAY